MSENFNKAEIILDSISPEGERLTTFILEYPQVIVPEFLRHRDFSLNSASLRAIPFLKNLSNTREKLWVPFSWKKQHKGMQGTDVFDEVESTELEKMHRELFEHVASVSTKMDELGVSKQITNRYLQMYGYVKQVVSGTNLDNFLALRCHPDAEEHIEDLAYKMLDALNASTPKLLQYHEWHLPFADKITYQDLVDAFPEAHEEAYKAGLDGFPDVNDMLIKISVARCARTSYYNFEDGSSGNFEKDFELHNRLLISRPVHASPAEHQATPKKGRHRNFNGWKQYRTMIPEDTVTNFELLKKHKPSKTFPHFDPVLVYNGGQDE